MTRHKSFKRSVRTRMHKTGERYSAARRQLIEQADGSALGQQTADSRQSDSQAPGTAPQTAARSAEPPVSESAVRAATGRGWDEWLAILDEWGAGERSHGEIARWLGEARGIGSWWAQSIAVGYERARGMRARHQQAGGFAVSASRTIGAPAERVSEAFSEPRLRGRWLPATELRERTLRPGRSGRFDWPDDGSRLIVGFTPRGEGRTQVAVQHERLADADAAERMKLFWRERLTALKELLEG